MKFDIKLYQMDFYFFKFIFQRTKWCLLNNDKRGFLFIMIPFLNCFASNETIHARDRHSKGRARNGRAGVSSRVKFRTRKRQINETKAHSSCARGIRITGTETPPANTSEILRLLQPSLNLYLNIYI